MGATLLAAIRGTTTTTVQSTLPIKAQTPTHHFLQIDNVRLSNDINYAFAQVVHEQHFSSSSSLLFLQQKFSKVRQHVTIDCHNQTTTAKEFIFMQMKQADASERYKNYFLTLNLISILFLNDRDR